MTLLLSALPVSDSALPAVQSQLRSRPEEWQHAQGVAQLSRGLALSLGLTHGEARRLGEAASWHDVGKLQLNPALLEQATPLTEAQWAQLRQHPRLGFLVLEHVDALAAEVALTHHERWDGGGYPRRLRAQAIPVAGRVVAVADALDAMTHDRPYRTGRCLRDALGVLRREAGQQFDPEVVDAACCRWG